MQGAGARRRWWHGAEVSSGTTVSVDGVVRMWHDGAGARRRWRSGVAHIGGLWRRARWCTSGVSGGAMGGATQR
ncbi:hypothetical protein U1Q18_040978 [Sarracenia purpurea var. burkii]